MQLAMKLWRFGFAVHCASRRPRGFRPQFLQNGRFFPARAVWCQEQGPVRERLKSIWTALGRMIWGDRGSCLPNWVLHEKARKCLLRLLVVFMMMAWRENPRLHPLIWACLSRFFDASSVVAQDLVIWAENSDADFFS